jgi:predicted transposase/invertase (TIGR01784 family)
MAANSKYINKKEESNDNSLGIFINPRTDFGFKKVFFDNEEAAISFLNAVLCTISPGHLCITSIIFKSVEFLGNTKELRHIIADIHLITNTGERIIIEMQFAHPLNFENRLAVYISWLMLKQIPPRNNKKGDDEKAEPWHYDLKPTRVVAITNFPMFSSKNERYKNTVIDNIQLMSTVTNKVFSNKINVNIIDLTRFSKKLEKLKTILDYWLYTLKYAETLTERPKEIKGEFFENLYENILRIDKLTPEEMKAYSESVSKYKDLSLYTDYSRMEGKAEGKAEGIAEVVLSIAENDFSAEYIASLTKLSVEQVRAILQNKK